MKRVGTGMPHQILLCISTLSVFVAAHVQLSVGPKSLDNGAVRDSNLREARDIRILSLKDPLDCLSQVVCGLNTYPPQKPSVRTSTANDFAYLLKNAVSRLRGEKIEIATTTTTVAPATKRSTTTAPLDDDEDEYDEDDTLENEDVDDDFDNYSDRPRYRSFLRQKRSSVFRATEGKSKTSKKTKKKEKSTLKKFPGKDRKKVAAKIYPLPSPQDRLRMEKDLRAKLLSNAQCINGLIDHTCPFNYQQMLNLISSSLERERTVSFSSQKVLPMVGYLIKLRNYTGTIEATFTAIERVNNYTIEADREGKPIDFSHILDEIMNRVTGDAGLRIVDTSNDSASASVWEDDEFDHVLQNPYERRRPSSDNYKLKKKKKPLQKPKPNEKEEADESTTSEEDTSEEGLIFDRPRPPRPSDKESSSEEDELNLEKVETQKKEEKRKKLSALAISDSKKKLVPPPVFGHLQKSAEDE